MFVSSFVGSFVRSSYARSIVRSQLRCFICSFNLRSLDRSFDDSLIHFARSSARSFGLRSLNPSMGS